MSSSAQEMTQLRDEIDSLRVARRAFIRDLKENVSQDRNSATLMMRAFRNVYTERARDDKTARVSFVSNLKAEVGDMVKGFGDDRTEMAAETKRVLLDYISKVKRCVIDLKDSAEEMLRDFNQGRSGMAREARERLRTHISDLQADVRNMLAGFENDRTHNTKEISAALQECLSNIKRFEADLKRDVFAMQTGFFTSRTEMARSDKEGREAFISDLKLRVAEIRRETQRVIQVFKDDARGAREVWRGIHPVKPAVRKKPHEAKTRETAKLVTEERKKDEEIDKPQIQEVSLPNVAKEPEGITQKRQTKSIVPDDLSKIEGIGPGRLRKLNDAGIFTFAQLAESTPETLRNALGEMSRLAPIDKWIEEAKKLSKEPL